LILVVDDDPSLRLVLREALEIKGFRVVEAGDGQEAVALCSSLRPELILLDVNMPRMNGFEACAAIRRLAGAETTPILILTGLDDLESVSRAHEAGATDFAVKPISLPILDHRVRYLLRAKSNLDKLVRSEERLARAQRIARLGNWEWDVQSGEIDWSEEMYRMYGMNPGPGAPARDRQLDRVHPDDRDMVSRAIVEALRGSNPV